MCSGPQLDSGFLDSRGRREYISVVSIHQVFGPSSQQPWETTARKRSSWFALRELAPLPNRLPDLRAANPEGLSVTAPPPCLNPLDCDPVRQGCILLISASPVAGAASATQVRRVTGLLECQTDPEFCCLHCTLGSRACWGSRALLPFPPFDLPLELQLASFPREPGRRGPHFPASFCCRTTSIFFCSDPQVNFPYPIPCSFKFLLDYFL